MTDYDRKGKQYENDKIENASKICYSIIILSDKIIGSQ